MGIVRTLLALAVLVGHAGSLYGLQMLPGSAAVQGFYIISGFYMSLVLDTKYPRTAQGTLLFYYNRYLRLIPTYWVVLLASAVTLAATGHSDYGSISELSSAFASLGATAKAWFVLVNVFIFGEDITMFMGIAPDAGTLFFTPDFGSVAQPAYHFLLIPQAWTLGVELTFYACAPFLLRASWPQRLVVFGASVVVRALLIRQGWSRDPWTYRFFPTELALFLMGNFAYHLYTHARQVNDRRYQWGGLISVIVAIFLVPVLPGPNKIKMAAFYILLTMSIPGMFALTRKLRWDNTIGEWSYPIYLIHMLLLGLFEKFGAHDAALAIVGSLLFSVAVVRVVEKPIETYRQKNVGRSVSKPGPSDFAVAPPDGSSPS